MATRKLLEFFFAHLTRWLIFGVFLGAPFHFPGNGVVQFRQMFLLACHAALDFPYRCGLPFVAQSFPYLIPFASCARLPTGKSGLDSSLHAIENIGAIFPLPLGFVAFDLAERAAKLLRFLHDENEA